MAIGAVVLTMPGCMDSEPVTFSVLTWNVGHPDASRPPYHNRLRVRAYEDRIGEAIRGRRPDVVFLQELLTPERCEGLTEPDPALTCHDAARREPAVRRLLGERYAIACDSGAGASCVAVRDGFGTIRGAPPGTTSFAAGTTARLPLPPCSRLAGVCDDTHCDAESSVCAHTVDTARGSLRLVHVHLMAPGKHGRTIFWGERCRARQLAQIFEGLGASKPLAFPSPTLVAGDFNLDPVRAMGIDEGAVWTRHVGPGRRFRDLAPRAESGTPFGTRRRGLGIATDHVLVDGLRGRCTVHGRSLGPDPGTSPLDDEFVARVLPNGPADRERIDHFALTCTLRFD